MKLLVLGGTRFLGRHFTRLALEADHEVTLFNRGQTNPDLFPDAEHLVGDRTEDLSPLSDGTWDAVIDTSGYHPEHVQATADLLSERVGHYTFVSTISVYADLSQQKIGEEAELATLEAQELAEVEEITEETYGPLKAASEQACSLAFAGNVFIVRPGLIVGPHDPTDRFTYWPRRMDRGGDVLAPGDPSRQVQLIDVRDLARWMLESVESDREGTYNATGPEGNLDMEQLLDACAEAVDADVDFIWVDEQFLLEAGVQPWSELPLWLPQEHNGLLSIDNERALSDGLEFRPLVETARDTFDWDQERGKRFHRGPGLGPARELALLQAWQAQEA